MRRGRLAARILAKFEPAEQALKFLSGPAGGELPALLGGVVGDVTPRLRGVGQPSFAFEQEGAGIHRGEVFRVEFVHTSPVGQRTVQIAPVCPDLAPVVDPARPARGG